MIKKKLLVIGAGLALSAMTVNAFADTLTLINNVGGQINVMCNGIPGLPVNSGTPRVIKYEFINIFGVDPICHFYLGDFSTPPIGTAQIHVVPGNAEAQVYAASTASGYSATVTGKESNGNSYVLTTPITSYTPEATDMSVAFNQ